MQTSSNLQRNSQRRAPSVEPDSRLSQQPQPQQQQQYASPPTSLISGQAGTTLVTRSSSGSGRSSSGKRRDPSQQLSQIEKSVTHLLIATKQLLETLTQWSRHAATEGEVSDVYVRLGYEFNIACRAFTSIGVDVSDLGPVPDLLRLILEETLSQEASPASLDRFLPKIRDIIINLLHGLKRKQQKLRSKQSKEGASSRQMSMNSVIGSAGGDTGLSQMLEDTKTKLSHRTSERRAGSGGGSYPQNESAVPGRTSSTHYTTPSSQGTVVTAEPPMTEHAGREGRSSPASLSDSSLSSTAMQNIPVSSPGMPSPDDYMLPIQSMSIRITPNDTPEPPPPPPPPKQQDALAALQRGGELERRASRRYSQYQISKHLGASSAGMPMLPPVQHSPVPNRGRDVRESLNAVRTRSSLLRQKSIRLSDVSPSRSTSVPRRISEESSGKMTDLSLKPLPTPRIDGSPLVRTPEERPAQALHASAGLDRPALSATLNGSIGGDIDALPQYGGDESEPLTPIVDRNATAKDRKAVRGAPGPSDLDEEQAIAEQAPQPGQELTLFLQYKSKIKKFVLLDGPKDLSLARLQLAFIEKFAWNTYSNGNDLPEIYIQDPVSGVRHELEDLSDIKDRSVLVLNVEVLDEVKRHIDEGLGGLRKIVEGVRYAIEGQQTTIQQVSQRQEDAAKEMAKLAPAPPPPTARTLPARTNGGPAPGSTGGSSLQVTEIQSLRRDLAVMRQSFTSFTTGIAASMTSIREKASTIKARAVDATFPTHEGDSGRAYVNAGKKSVGKDSENLVNRVDDLQDIVEDLRKDVVSRGVRPLPRQLEVVNKDITAATQNLKRMQEYVRREKPIWTKMWEKELEMVCSDREFLTMQEELIADLEDDLEKATQTFALVEEATKQQHQQSAVGNPVTLRSSSRGMTGSDGRVDAAAAKEGVLGEVRALQPNHETRLEAIERAEKARQRELEERREGAFKKELGAFVLEGKLRKSGGVDEAERLRRAKDERNLRGEWEHQEARKSARTKEKVEGRARAEAANGNESEAEQGPVDEPEDAQTNGAQEEEEEEEEDGEGEGEEKEEREEEERGGRASSRNGSIRIPRDREGGGDDDDDATTGTPRKRKSWLPSLFTA